MFSVCNEKKNSREETGLEKSRSAASNGNLEQDPSIHPIMIVQEVRVEDIKIFQIY